MTSVLVAVVGVVGTAAGALLAAIIAARTENRRQAALERQQLRQELIQRDDQIRELRIEHLRWRRERRQAAYLDFLDALSLADRANQQYFRNAQAEQHSLSIDEARAAEIRQYFKDAEKIGHRVLLEGPSSVADAASELVALLGNLVRGVDQYVQAYSTPVDDHARLAAAVESIGQAYLTAHRDFLDVARTALDEITEAD